MALPYYVTIEGANQGNIEGSNSMAGHETEIQGHALEQSIQIPYNHETGKPQGIRIHGAIKITKSFDKASPKLYQALVTGEQLAKVVLTFWRIDPAGMEENYFTMTLTNATIVEIKPIMLNHFDPHDNQFDHMEEMSVTYEQIEWLWCPDGIVAADERVAAT